MPRHDHGPADHGGSNGTVKTSPCGDAFSGDGSPALSAEQAVSRVAHELKTPISASTNAVHLAHRALRAGDALDVGKRLDMVARQLRRWTSW